MMKSDLETFMQRHEHLCGEQRMDQLHDEFFVLLQALRHAQPETEATALMDIITHTREHFAYEDTQMVNTDYSVRECHIEEHAAVLASLVEVYTLLCQGNREPLPRLVDALETWFPGHVQHLDSALAQWLVKRQHNAQPIMLRRNAAVRPAS